MRVISASVKNFASYKELDFGFDKQGLCLIQGATGSGKSTLCDIIPWILFGKTAKDGGVDEIRPWSDNEDTIGHIKIWNGTNAIAIRRVRGKSNDLFFILDDQVTRGKDITDTQRLINSLLGFDYDTYTTGAYFHEFSKTAGFFTATAKIRRAILDQVVDLTTAKKLQDKVFENKKEVKKELDVLARDFAIVSNDRARSLSQIKTYVEKSEHFEQDLAQEKATLERRIEGLVLQISAEENKLAALVKKSVKNTCDHCGSTKDKSLRDSIKGLELSISNNLSKLEANKIELDKPKVNNFKDLIALQETRLNKAEKTISTIEKGVEKYTQRKVDLDLLSEVIDAYRASVITTTVGFLEDNTNMLLSNYFDAELKVLFAVESSDKLDVTVYKDGNECSYTQLSKGQRQLLKLCFGLSIMKCVANHKGINFSSIFLDEALDGLDDVLKVKAYSLLQSLQTTYGSIFVVEHSAELKALFEKSFIVTNQQGASYVDEK